MSINNIYEKNLFQNINIKYENILGQMSDLNVFDLNINRIYSSILVILRTIFLLSDFRKNIFAFYCESNTADHIEDILLKL